MPLPPIVSLRRLSALAALALCSCSANRFYSSVHPGEIVSAPIVQWTGPDKFELVARSDAPFEFRRFNGEVIRPDPINTDGGSVPRQFWNVRGLSPWTYAPGYLVHDWLYEAHRRDQLPAGMSKDGQPLYYSREQADLILAEIIKTQMTDERQKAKGDPSPLRLFAIYKAVRRFGQKPFEAPSEPVENPMVLTGLQNTVGSVVPDLVKKPLRTLTLQIQPVPAQPERLEGYTAPVKE